MPLYRLSNKAVLRLGPKAFGVIKDISTGLPSSSSNAFIDLQGRIVATFDQIALDPDNVLIVLEHPFVARLKDHLKTYLFLNDSALRDEPLSVYFDLAGDFQIREGEFSIPQRHGRIILSARKSPCDVNDAVFTGFRLQHGIPVQGTDYDQDMLLNVGDEEFICHTKGCYLGQEIIARVRDRGRPPKKLVVKRLDACTADEAARMTSRAVNPDTGKEMGFVFVANE